MNDKECIKCKEIKPESKFYRLSDYGKLRNDCKKCRNLYHSACARAKRQVKKKRMEDREPILLKLITLQVK